MKTINYMNDRQYTDMAVTGTVRKTDSGISLNTKGLKGPVRRIKFEDENSNTDSCVLQRQGSIHSCPSIDSDSDDLDAVSQASSSSSSTPTLCRGRRRHSSLALSEYDVDGFKVALHNKFGKRGTGKGNLQNATGIVHLYSGTVIVSDMILSRLTLFGSSGRYQSQFSTGHASEPWGCDILNNGSIVCALGHEHCVAVYTLEGKTLRTFGDNILQKPIGISGDRSNRIIVTDISLNDVFIFDFHGRLQLRLNEVNKDLKLNQPRYVTTTKDNMIVISDSGNHCIHICSTSGHLIRTFGKYGSEDGEFRFPYGVVSDSDGQVYVADHYNNRISMFTSSGEFIRHVVSSNMRLRRPQGLTLHKTLLNNTLFVTHGDLKAHEVAAFRLSGDSDQLKISINALV